MRTYIKIYIAGGDTMLGKGLIDSLRRSPTYRLVGADEEPDLTRRHEVDRFFANVRPEVVIVAAGASGGIHANQAFPADLMLDNLLVSSHLLSAAAQVGVRKLLYLGSSCMYPAQAPQPLRTESLGNGPLERTSEAYATAKLAGTRMCQAYRRQYGSPFIVGIPANCFGPNDDFAPSTSHVIPSLLRRMHEAKLRDEPTVEIWGSGTPVREFLYVDDFVRACFHVLDHYDSDEPINLGSGQVFSIAQTARQTAEVVGYRGQLHFDRTRPDGMPHKELDSTKLLDIGWKPSTDFSTALKRTYAWFLHRIRTENPTNVLVHV